MNGSPGSDGVSLGHPPAQRGTAKEVRRSGARVIPPRALRAIGARRVRGVHVRAATPRETVEASVAVDLERARRRSRQVARPEIAPNSSSSSAGSPVSARVCTVSNARPPSRARQSCTAHRSGPAGGSGA